MMHWGGDFGMGFGLGFGWIFMILFWVLIILGVVYLVKALFGGPKAQEKRGETAREVLEKRFTKGELSKEEFEDAIEVLKRNKE
jgi:putative membrane protein